MHLGRLPFVLKPKSKSFYLSISRPAAIHDVPTQVSRVATQKFLIDHSMPHSIYFIHATTIDLLFCYDSSLDKLLLQQCPHLYRLISDKPCPARPETSTVSLYPSRLQHLNLGLKLRWTAAPTVVARRAEWSRAECGFDGHVRSKRKQWRLGDNMRGLCTVLRVYISILISFHA